MPWKVDSTALLLTHKALCIRHTECLDIHVVHPMLLETLEHCLHRVELCEVLRRTVAAVTIVPAVSSVVAIAFVHHHCHRIER